MMGRPLSWVLVLVLAGFAPLGAQGTASGRATIEIGELMSLRVLPGGGVAVAGGDGRYRELEGAVRLEVVSNRAWQLSVESVGPDGRVAGSGAGEPVRALWWRLGTAVDGVEPVTGAGVYRRAEGRAEVVARGRAGRTTLELDYRWLSEAGRDAGPGVVLNFTLSAD